jgi:hypothetical protein
MREGVTPAAQLAASPPVLQLPAAEPVQETEATVSSPARECGYPSVWLEWIPVYTGMTGLKFHKEQL